MSNMLYNLFSIQQILAKMSVVLFQPLKNESKQDWVYRGEGNANLVISLPDKRQILRIQKADKPETFLIWLLSWISEFLYWDRKCELVNDNLDLKFYKQVMMPLLGKFVCDATPIIMTKKQTRDLNKAITQYRPHFRKHKSLQFGRATFFADFAFLPKHLESFRLNGATYAVEIKPKQGWMPLKSKESKCQFCQNQFLKMQQGQIKKISGYCPLDLFSGEKKKMIKAIKSLINNPQNNFKVFRNGIFVYGDHVSIDVFYDLLKEMMYSETKMSASKLLEEFCDMLYATLIKEMDKPYSNHKCISLNHTSTTKKYMANNILPKGCILKRILSIQKFDQLGLEYYQKLINSTNCNTNDKKYVEKLLKEVTLTKCPKCVIKKYINRGFNPDKKNICELDFVPYLLASVANDCSLMLTYRRSTSRKSLIPEEHFLERSIGNFVVNVGVFDLYPKPLSTIDKHTKRKLKIDNLLFHSSTGEHIIV